LRIEGEDGTVDEGDDDSSNDGDIGRQISLDIANSSEDEDEDDDADDDDDDDELGRDDDDDADNAAFTKEEEGSESEDEEKDSNADSDHENERDDEIDTAWGRSSSQYYAGDTADLEIGQDFQESKEEEAIAKQMQARRRKAEDESDYLIGDSVGNGALETATSRSQPLSAKQHAQRDVSKLSSSEQLERLNRESPELLGLLSEMQVKLNELSLLGLALDEAHTNQSSAVTDQGLTYLELRHHLLLSYVMNVNMYLLLKADSAAEERRGLAGGSAAVGGADSTASLLASSGGDVRLHPVVDQLLKLQRALDKLKPLEKKGKQAVAMLVQRAAQEVFESESEDESGDGEGKVEDEEVEGGRGENDNEAESDDKNDAVVEASDAVVEESDAEDDELGRRAAKAVTKAKADVRARAKATTATGTALSADAPKKKKKSEKKKQAAALMGTDIGDMDDDEKVTGAYSAKLQASYNTMVQKQKSSRKSSSIPAGDVDVPISATTAQRPQKSVVGSAEITDTFFGGGSDGSGDDDDDDGEGEGDEGGDYFKQQGAKKKKGPESDEDDDEFAKFYRELASAGAAKSAKRKDRYEVAPRVAGDHLEDVETGVKRAASYQIIKNRGLVPSKAKINRNPRVKKKEQYRKAVIARKGQVRDIRDSGEGALYGGESTGIKSSISRSRKITN